MIRHSPGRFRGLATRLLIGQSMVLIVGALTAGLVAILIGPPIFHNHLLQAGESATSPELIHIELAYRDASLISLGVGLLLSLVAAAVVTWFVSGRLRRPLDEVAHAARELSRGHYTARVPTVGPGTELETLATAFNTMAARLEGVEETRRRLLSDLAHELRTPIATLSAYHEALHDGVVELGPESRATLAEQTERLARLADDIDEVSTAEEGRLRLELQQHQVTDLISTAREAVRDRYAAHGVSLVLELASSAGLEVTVDRTRLGQVLTNLLGNALRHTPPGGTVTLSGHREGDEAIITVSDDGEGMTAEQLQHAFERFYRGDTARTRDRGGSGIGLTISKAIIDAHDGSLTATSAGPGRGAEFLISLPILVR